jgi:hypothetical protein
MAKSMYYGNSMPDDNGEPGCEVWLMTIARLMTKVRLMAIAFLMAII